MIVLVAVFLQVTIHKHWMIFEGKQTSIKDCFYALGVLFVTFLDSLFSLFSPPGLLSMC